MKKSAEGQWRQVDKSGKKESGPNILLIMTSHQRWDTLRAGGAPWMKTPCLDKLAREGCLFTNAFSNNPEEGPARHTLLTGRPFRDFGSVPIDGGGPKLFRVLPRFPELLSYQGYETRTIGKNHFFPPRNHNGYHNMELMQERPAFREQDEYLMYLKERGYGHVQNVHGVESLLYMAPQRSLLPEDCHGTSWAASRGVEFIETNAGRHSWLLSLGFIAPHPPLNMPPGWEDLYKEADFPGPRGEVTPLSLLSEENRLKGDISHAAVQRRMQEAYYALVSHLDHHIGRVLDALERSGQRENTLVIFTSSEGELLGDLGLFGAGLPYDSCTRVPLILRWPERIAPQSVRGDFVDLADLYPTVLQAAGVEGFDSEELLGEDLLRGERKKDRTWQFVECSSGNRRWISLRTSEWKYNWYFGGGREELYHLALDPGETKNLLEEEAGSYKEIREELRQKLILCENRWGAGDSVAWGELKVREAPKLTLTRNRNFPLFGEQITDPFEKLALNDYFDEVTEAIALEPSLIPQELDTQAWQKNGGFSSKIINRWLEDNKRTSPGRVGFPADQKLPSPG